ncbi:MAG: haloacid dehalogenase type II, partial [Burkholderiales bacterium]
MPSLTSTVKAMVFDVFGSVVDWRGSIIRGLTRWGQQNATEADWALLADKWRALYQPQMERVRAGHRPWTILDVLHRESLDQLLPEFGLGHLTESQRDHVNRVWHRLDAWPDSIAGLNRLKSRYIIGPLSNGNVPLLTNMGKYAVLPWDAI